MNQDQCALTVPSTWFHIYSSQQLLDDEIVTSQNLQEAWRRRRGGHTSRTAATISLQSSPLLQIPPWAPGPTALPPPLLLLETAGSSAETPLLHLTSPQAKSLWVCLVGKSGSQVCAPVPRGLRKYRVRDSL